MRNTILWFLPLTVFVIFQSCDSDNTSTTNKQADATSETTTPIEYTGQMSVQVDGEVWETTKVHADYQDFVLIVTGEAANGGKLTLEIGDTPEVGIFPIKRRSLNAATYNPDGGSTKYYSPQNNTNGVINISAIDDKEVKGTFSFMAASRTDYVQLEEGSFTAPLATPKEPLQ